MDKTIFTILTLLDQKPMPVSSGEVARHLRSRGIDLSERTVRHYLNMLEAKGYAEGEKRRGRRLTDRGRQELTCGSVSERIGFVMNRISSLCFLSDFNIDTLNGRVILNVACVAEDQAERALSLLKTVLDSPYAVSNKMVMVGGGGRLGDLVVPAGFVAMGTICSITLSSVLLKAGIPVSSRFGGLVEIVDHTPTRFTSVIGYESSSIAPLELFMKSRMTNVAGALRDGRGSVLGSLREIPEASLNDARALNDKMERNGFSGVALFGRSGDCLLGVPVTPGNVGLVVLGGLNPMAALEEAGISTETTTMATLSEYGELGLAQGFEGIYFHKDPETQELVEHFHSKRCQDASTCWSILSEMQQSTF